MASLPPIVQEFRADTSQYTRAIRIVVKHLTALAEELEQAGLPAFPLPVMLDDPESTGPAVHLGSTGGPGPEHDLCAPPSEGGLCGHAEEDEGEGVCRGGRHCSC